VGRQPPKVHKIYESAIQELLEQISKRSRRLSDRDAHIAELEVSLQEKASQIHSLESQIHSLESQIQWIQRSIPMQLVSRYQIIVEKLLRSGTHRRRYYELVLTGIRVILNEGWKSFVREAKAHLPGKKDRASKQP
jgi:chromosome segregation ATPase